jgi:hypothetical protein
MIMILPGCFLAPSAREISRKLVETDKRMRAAGSGKIEIGGEVETVGLSDPKGA